MVTLAACGAALTAVATAVTTSLLRLVSPECPGPLVIEKSVYRDVHGAGEYKRLLALLVVTVPRLAYEIARWCALLVPTLAFLGFATTVALVLIYCGQNARKWSGDVKAFFARGAPTGTASSSRGASPLPTFGFNSWMGSDFGGSDSQITEQTDGASEGQPSTRTEGIPTPLTAAIATPVGRTEHAAPSGSTGGGLSGRETRTNPPGLSTPASITTLLRKKMQKTVAQDGTLPPFPRLDGAEQTIVSASPTKGSEVVPLATAESPQTRGSTSLSSAEAATSVTQNAQSNGGQMGFAEASMPIPAEGTHGVEAERQLSAISESAEGHSRDAADPQLRDEQGREKAIRSPRSPSVASEVASTESNGLAATALATEASSGDAQTLGPRQPQETEPEAEIAATLEASQIMVGLTAELPTSSQSAVAEKEETTDGVAAASDSLPHAATELQETSMQRLDSSSKATQPPVRAAADSPKGTELPSQTESSEA